MTTIIAPMCMSCVHYNRDDKDKFSCEAYPKGIPQEIIMSDVDHRKPYEGDNGMQFGQDKDKSTPLVFEMIFDKKKDAATSR